MKYLLALFVFVCGEFIALFIFWALGKSVGTLKDSPTDRWATTRGIIERLTLLTGLLYNFPHILIAFGALKIGTRLSVEQRDKISNNYFLIGNLISLLLAMIYAIVIKAMWCD